MSAIEMDWSTAKTIIFTLGPLLGPRLLSWFRSSRAPSASPEVSSISKPGVIPLTRESARSLNLIFLSAFVFLIATLPIFAPRNIFILTESRIQIPTDVLFTRLEALGPLTRDDLALQTKLVSFEARLLYMMWGPGPLANCLFCNSDDFYSYFYYALPSLLLPHLLHLTLLGLATSPTLTSRKTSRFRVLALFCATAIASADLGAATSFNHKINTSAFRLADIDFFAWRRRVVSLLCLCFFDLFFAAFLYLTSTNRFLVKAITPAERLEASAKALETAHGKLHAVGIARNVIMRDESLRGKMETYWNLEGRMTREIFEEREVVSGVQSALTRMDVQEIAREAGKFADGLVGGVQMVPVQTAEAEKT